ncbi:hypothetical protein F4604DRAFT_1968770 [Suillus subluteus]|nr:hypothetical protein F4604DRAFT_1968770 [Suillus subluteus]
MNSFIQDSTIDLSLDLQQHYAHLLVFPQCYDSFIPAPHLPISALLDFTNLPPFDHSLTVADLHRFFTSEHCVTNDVPADFLDRSLPPLSLSTQLLNTFSQAYHDGVKSVKDPRFLGNLPFWVVQYWHDLGCAIAAKERWSLARDWLSGQRENADTDLAAAIDEVFSSLRVLGWGTTLRGPAAALQKNTRDPDVTLLGSVRGVGDAVTNLRSNGYSNCKAHTTDLPPISSDLVTTAASDILAEIRRWIALQLRRCSDVKVATLRASITARHYTASNLFKAETEYVKIIASSWYSDSAVYAASQDGTFLSLVCLWTINASQLEILMQYEVPGSAVRTALECNRCLHGINHILASASSRAQLGSGGSSVACSSA